MGVLMFRTIALATLGFAAAPALAVTTSVKVEGTSGVYVDSVAAGAQSFSGTVAEGDYAGSADTGVLKSSVTVDVGPLAVDGFQSKGLGSIVSVTDVLTVNAPGLTSGSFLATLLIDGVLSPRATSLGPSGNAGLPNFTITVELPDSALTVFDFSYTASNYNGFIGGGGSLQGQRYSGPYTGAFDFLIPFDNLVGQNVKISLRCGVLALAVRAGDTAGGDCAFAHTVKWGGVSQVFNQFNAPVAGASITGGGGANYLNSFGGGGGPVPEPAAWALLIAGFGLAGAVQRRRRVVAV